MDFLNLIFQSFQQHKQMYTHLHCVGVEININPKLSVRLNTIRGKWEHLFFVIWVNPLLWHSQPASKGIQTFGYNNKHASFMLYCYRATTTKRKIKNNIQSRAERSTVCLKASGEPSSQALAVQSLHWFMNSVFHICNLSVSEIIPHVKTI